MRSITELAQFVPVQLTRERVGMPDKITASSSLLGQYIEEPEVAQAITPQNFLLGVVPRLSPYDIRYLPEGARLVEVPKEVQDRLRTERSIDLIKCNLPERFLKRLQIGQGSVKSPIPGNSRVMDRLKADGFVVSFDDLKIDSPEPQNGRESRSNVETEIKIMGQARIPFALGSVPDVGSFLSYVTMAQSNGMVFISRDKLLSNVDNQARLARDVITHLQTVALPQELYPNDDQLDMFMQIMGLSGSEMDKEHALDKYTQALRDSWKANVGAAIEADAVHDGKSIRRAQALYEAGCRLFRIYSPEGGVEIISTINSLKKEFQGDKSVKIVAGQVMDVRTAQKVEAAEADALFIGVAGGSQCTTSVNADIPVKTPNLLYDLRGRIQIPVGIEGGGVGTHIATALALGASFLSKPGEIGVSWEGAGGQLMFQGPNGKYYMIYGGEASVSAKWWKDSIDTAGRPKFVEGETGVREVTEDKLSQTGNIRRLMDILANGLVYQRANSIPQLHARDCENIVQVTDAARKLSLPYGS